MERCRRCLHLDGAVRHNLGLGPATLQAPVDGEHVVGEDFPERDVLEGIGFDLADRCGGDLQLVSLYNMG